jgi:4a-hydroxytetrahydrobiopterin dehydratase
MISKTDLAKKNCIPCKGGVSPMKSGEIENYIAIMSPGWTVCKEHHLEKEYKFHDFKKALEFTNKLGEIAEDQGHHPDIYLSWGMVRVTIWTHKIDGLTENDFVYAAKCDKAYE